MYRPVDPKVSFPKTEEKVLAFWQKEGIFEKSIAQREGGEEFVFYDGPPFATGLPHFGHFVPSTVKDVIPRYQTMRGRKVERRFGWDCHGLPVEYEMEKELGISGKRQIESSAWPSSTSPAGPSCCATRASGGRSSPGSGRWVDFDHDYKTMDPDYMESMWWVLAELWKKGLLYEGHYILPYCPRCSTSLSNFELNLGGYLDVADPAITVKFALDGEPNTFILAWTTTPWTLPSNLALALGADIRYVKVKDGEESYILAEDRLGAYYKKPAECEIVARFTGAELAGRSYTPLFPFFAALKEKGAFRTWTGRLRHDRGRHGGRAHRARFRRGRLQPAQGHGHSRRVPRRRGGAVHRRGPRLRGRVREGRRQGDHPQAQGRAQAREARLLHAQLSPLLALQEPAHLPRRSAPGS